MHEATFSMTGDEVQDLAAQLPGLMRLRVARHDGINERDGRVELAPGRQVACLPKALAES